MDDKLTLYRQQVLNFYDICHVFERSSVGSCVMFSPLTFSENPMQSRYLSIFDALPSSLLLRIETTYINQTLHSATAGQEGHSRKMRVTSGFIDVDAVGCSHYLSFTFTYLSEVDVFIVHSGWL